MRFARTLVALSDLIARSLIFELKMKAAWQSSPELHMASAFAVDSCRTSFQQQRLMPCAVLPCMVAKQDLTAEWIDKPG